MTFALLGRSAHRAVHVFLPSLHRRCPGNTLQRRCQNQPSVIGGFCSGVPSLHDDKLNIIIECSFQHGRSFDSDDPVATFSYIHNIAVQGNDVELRSLARQLVNVHALCKNHPVPCNVVATGVDDTLREACQKLSPGKWNVAFHRDSLPAFLPAERNKQVVALSPDAREVLQHVDPGDVFVVGGIIDRTPHKYVSLFYAQEHSIQAKKLPLEGNVTLLGQGSMNAKWFLLNVDHVLHTLLEYQAHGDWHQAFDTVLPERKRRRR